MSTCKITFLPENKTVEANVGDKLTDVAEKNGIEIPKACGGNGACSTCKITIKKGDFEPANENEEMWGLPEKERLGCQCIIKEDVTIELEN